MLDTTTDLKGFLPLRTSKPNQMRTGICSRESKGLLVEEMAPNHESQGSHFSKTWVPRGFSGVPYIGEESSIVVTKGARVLVRAVVSTDWPALG